MNKAIHKAYSEHARALAAAIDANLCVYLSFGAMCREPAKFKNKITFKTYCKAHAKIVSAPYDSKMEEMEALK